MNDSIPLVDLGLQHRRIADEVRAGFDRVFSNTSFILGPEADTFEKAYAEYCGAAHCVGVGNGTDAIELALRAAGIGAGHEVIAPANTFVATAEAIARAGAELVLVDCAEDYLVDPELLSTAVTPNTRAIIGVHLYGQMAPMKAIREIAGPDVVLIEDAAQSQGARQDGARSGSVGLAAATSFYPGKNLGAYGDAGAVTTSDQDIDLKLRQLRNHGGINKYEHVEIGVNSRLDGLQAVVLSTKLRVLDAWNDERRAAASRYGEMLADLPQVITPTVAQGNEHVWHLYVVRVAERDRVLAELNASGIGAGIHYPSPVHLLPAFAGLGHGPGAFPVAERLATEILSLPIFPGITEAQQVRVVEALTSAVA